MAFLAAATTRRRADDEFADGRKVKGTLHWVSAAQSIPAEVGLYETLFSVEDPMDVSEGEDFIRSR